MNWNSLFETARRIAVRSGSVTEGMDELCVWALRRKPYAGSAVWERMRGRDWTQSQHTVTGWLREALEQLPKKPSDVLLVELGDCPELFEIRRLTATSEHGGVDGIRAALAKQAAVHYEALPQIDWFGKQPTVGQQHFNYKIPDDFWTTSFWGGKDDDACDTECGYAIWLCFALLAVAACLRNVPIQMSPKQAAASLPLLAGYEQLFTGFGEISAKGWRPPCVS